MNIRIMERGKDSLPFAKIDERDAWYAEIDTANGVRFAIREKDGGIIITTKDDCMAIYPHGDNQVSVIARRRNEST